MRLRLCLTAVLAALGLHSSVWAQESDQSTSTVSGSPWVKNRAIGEGEGVKTGSVEWHPGVSAEFGYDSNYLQRANSAVDETNFGPVVPSLRLRITPQVSLRTYYETSPGAPPPVVAFDVSGSASYNEFFPLREGESEFRSLRNLEGGLSGALNIMPQRVWSGQVRAGYVYTAEPSNQGGLGSQFDRHTLNAGGKVAWAPGGGAFRWTLLDYNTRFTLFDEGAFGVYNNGTHTFGTNGFWRFLPKTSVLYDGSVSLVRYTEPGINNGDSMQARLGLTGLITKKLSALVMGGWAASFYRDRTGLVRNYDSWIGNAEIKWFFTPEGRLHDGSADVGASAVAVGVIRDFNDSYLGDFYRRHRVFLQGSYLIGGRVVTTLETGMSRITYPDYLFDGAAEPGFGETRIDVQGFVEYRVIKTVGINLQLRYDQNLSQVITGANYEDDLDFNRFQAILGARWFL